MIGKRVDSRTRTTKVFYFYTVHNGNLRRTPLMGIMMVLSITCWYICLFK